MTDEATKLQPCFFLVLTICQLLRKGGLLFLFSLLLVTTVLPASAQRTISGAVTLEANAPHGKQVVFEWVSLDNPATSTQPVTLGNGGTYTLSGIPTGTYALGVKGSKWLKKVVTIGQTGNIAGLNFSLKAGDVNNDNNINVDDLTLLLNAYSTNAGNAAYNPNADLNSDNAVNVDDLTLLLNNYNVQGDTMPQPSSVHLTSLIFGLYNLNYKDSADGTIKLSAPASVGGVTVLLRSDNPALQIPATVVVPGGSTEAPFHYSAGADISNSTITVTASQGGVSDSDDIVILPPMRLNIAATGSGKLSLYWVGLNDFTRYNIYRSLSQAGPYTKINATPVTSRDPGPGVTNGHLYNDTGLSNSTDYYYYVVAVAANGTEDVRSDGDSDRPNPNGIPWDTGNASLILSKVRPVAEGTVPDPDILPLNPSVTAIGPNGVLYQNDPTGGAAFAGASNVSYDSSSNTITNPDGSLTPGPPGRKEQRAKNVAEIIRKLTARGTQTSFFSWCGLPPTNSPPYVALPNLTNTNPGQPTVHFRDAIYYETGGVVKGVNGSEVDAAVTLGTQGNARPDAGWKALVRTNNIFAYPELTGGGVLIFTPGKTLGLGFYPIPSSLQKNLSFYVIGECKIVKNTTSILLDGAYIYHYNKA